MTWEGSPPIRNLASERPTVLIRSGVAGRAASAWTSARLIPILFGPRVRNPSQMMSDGSNRGISRRAIARSARTAGRPTSLAGFTESFPVVTAIRAQCLGTRFHRILPVGDRPASGTRRSLGVCKSIDQAIPMSRPSSVHALATAPTHKPQYSGRPSNSLKCGSRSLSRMSYSSGIPWNEVVTV